jgi:ABC-type antimicrobial peptide transport system permease subunit
VAESLTMVVAGLIVGLPIALAVSRGLGTMLFEVSPADPLTVLAVSTLLVVTALAASYLPARAASRINPTDALRHE